MALAVDEIGSVDVVVGVFEKTTLWLWLNLVRWQK